jgi:hypothetical protein
MFTGKAGAYPSGAPVLPPKVGPWPYPQTLDQAGKACQGQML